VSKKCKSQAAIKLANILPKRLSHNYGRSLAVIGTVQINSRNVPFNFKYLLGCMTHTAPTDYSCLALLTYLLRRLLEYSIRYSTEYSVQYLIEYSGTKKHDSPSPVLGWAKPCTFTSKCIL